MVDDPKYIEERNEASAFYARSVGSAKYGYDGFKAGSDWATKRIELDIEDEYMRGLLKGSEVGDATARRIKKECDADFDRINSERREFVEERNQLRAELDLANKTLSEWKEREKVWTEMMDRQDASTREAKKEIAELQEHLKLADEGFKFVLDDKKEYDRLNVRCERYKEALETTEYHLRCVLKTCIRTDGLDMRATGKVLTIVEKALRDGE